MAFRSMEWREEGTLRLLDQRKLPSQKIYLELNTVEAVAEAIRTMAVRGAPAIADAAAYGLALAAVHSRAEDLAALKEELLCAEQLLRASRPTAVNLFWAMDRMHRVIAAAQSLEELRGQVLAEAHAIAQEDAETNRRIAAYGAALIPDPACVIHHCNTGSLATFDYGTALGIIRMAHEQGKRVRVLVDETRPRLQGARLTTWELLEYGIPHTLIVDGASGFYMDQGGVDLCLVGADRIAANGDTANKIGTYNLAVVAKAHGVPFYVAAPLSTIDLQTPTGEDIPVEERSAAEITMIEGIPIAPEGAVAANPAFDITPAAYITAFITECGVIKPPFAENLRRAKEASCDVYPT